MKALIVCHEDLIPPGLSTNLKKRSQYAPWKTEYEVARALIQMGHIVQFCGVRNSLKTLKRKVDSSRPNYIFNILEEVWESPLFEHIPVTFYEALRIPYTGCSAQVLVRLKNKNAVNKILKKSGVLVPKVFRRQDFNTSKTDFRPVILKFATEHASFALRKTSIVKNEVELVREIIRYKKLSRAPVYIEEFVRGREISVAVMYIKRRHLVMRPMETVFLKSKDKAQEILTEKIKWDLKLRRQRKVVLRPVPDSEASLQNKVKHAAMKICRALEIDGPVRLDFRLAEDNKLYLIDANPNPDLGARFEFHESCRLDGISYGNMIKHIVNCALE